MGKVIAEVSGGFDSAMSTLLALEKSDDVHGIFAAYGQPYEEQERSAVHYLKYRFNQFPNWRGVQEVRLQIATGQSIPGAPAEYVPIRNLVLASVSLNYAIALGADVVVVGSKSDGVRPDDPYSFKDSCAEFYRAVADVATRFSEDGRRVEIQQPLKGWTKGRVLRELNDRGIVLNRLWNCYQSGPDPCGKCYHCREVQMAIEKPA